MPTFSDTSKAKLDTCDTRLRDLFLEVIRYVDCTVIEGYRSPEDQLKAYNTGHSKLKIGKHNTSPSLAVDVAPYLTGQGIPWPVVPRDWNIVAERTAYLQNINQFYYFAGIVMGIAAQKKLPIRWGGDWTRDNITSNETFLDLVHFEIDNEAWTIKT